MWPCRLLCVGLACVLLQPSSSSSSSSSSDIRGDYVGLARSQTSHRESQRSPDGSHEQEEAANNVRWDSIDNGRVPSKAKRRGGENGIAVPAMDYLAFPNWSLVNTKKIDKDRQIELASPQQLVQRTIAIRQPLIETDDFKTKLVKDYLFPDMDVNVVDQRQGKKKKKTAHHHRRFSGPQNDSLLETQREIDRAVQDDSSDEIENLEEILKFIMHGDRKSEEEEEEGGEEEHYNHGREFEKSSPSSGNKSDFHADYDDDEDDGEDTILRLFDDDDSSVFRGEAVVRSAVASNELLKKSLSDFEDLLRQFVERVSEHLPDAVADVVTADDDIDRAHGHFLHLFYVLSKEADISKEFTKNVEDIFALYEQEEESDVLSDVMDNIRDSTRIILEIMEQVNHLRDLAVDVGEEEMAALRQKSSSWVRDQMRENAARLDDGITGNDTSALATALATHRLLRGMMLRNTKKIVRFVTSQLEWRTGHVTRGNHKSASSSDVDIPMVRLTNTVHHEHTPSQIPDFPGNLSVVNASTEIYLELVVNLTTDDVAEASKLLYDHILLLFNLTSLSGRSQGFEGELRDLIQSRLKDVIDERLTPPSEWGSRRPSEQLSKDILEKSQSITEQAVKSYIDSESRKVGHKLSVMVDPRERSSSMVKSTSSAGRDDDHILRDLTQACMQHTNVSSWRRRPPPTANNNNHHHHHHYNGKRSGGGRSPEDTYVDSESQSVSKEVLADFCGEMGSIYAYLYSLINSSTVDRETMLSRLSSLVATKMKDVIKHRIFPGAASSSAAAAENALVKAALPKATRLADGLLRQVAGDVVARFAQQRLHGNRLQVVTPRAPAGGGRHGNGTPHVKGRLQLLPDHVLTSASDMIDILNSRQYFPRKEECPSCNYHALSDVLASMVDDMVDAQEDFVDNDLDEDSLIKRLSHAHFSRGDQHTPNDKVPSPGNDHAAGDDDDDDDDDDEMVAQANTINGNDDEMMRPQDDDKDLMYLLQKKLYDKVYDGHVTPASVRPYGVRHPHSYNRYYRVLRKPHTHLTARPASHPRYYYYYYPPQSHYLLPLHLTPVPHTHRGIRHKHVMQQEQGRPAQESRIKLRENYPLDGRYLLHKVFQILSPIA